MWVFRRFRFIPQTKAKSRVYQPGTPSAFAVFRLPLAKNFKIKEIPFFRFFSAKSEKHCISRFYVSAAYFSVFSVAEKAEGRKVTHHRYE